MSTCPDCGGNGQISWLDENDYTVWGPCPKCDGTGQLETDAPTLSTDVELLLGGLEVESVSELKQLVVIGRAEQARNARRTDLAQTVAHIPDPHERLLASLDLCVDEGHIENGLFVYVNFADGGDAINASGVWPSEADAFLAGEADPEENVSRVVLPLFMDNVPGRPAPTFALEQRRVEATAAFDKRSDDPKKDFGIHGVEFRFSLVRPTAAVSFGISTGWYLPETIGDSGESSSTYRRALRESFTANVGAPLPMGMYFHIAEPNRDYLREQEPRDCDLLPGGRCWGDVTFTGSDRPFFALIKGGTEAMWETLAAELDAFCAPESE